MASGNPTECNFFRKDKPEKCRAKSNGNFGNPRVGCCLALQRSGNWLTSSYSIVYYRIALDRTNGGGAEYGGDGDRAVVCRGAVRARVFSAFLIVDRCLVRRVRHSQQPSTRTPGGNK